MVQAVSPCLARYTMGSASLMNDPSFFFSNLLPRANSPQATGPPSVEEPSKVWWQITCRAWREMWAVQKALGVRWPTVIAGTVEGVVSAAVLPGKHLWTCGRIDRDQRAEDRQIRWVHASRPPLFSRACATLRKKFVRANTAPH